MFYTFDKLCACVQVMLFVLCNTNGKNVSFTMVVLLTTGIHIVWGEGSLTFTFFSNFYNFQPILIISICIIKQY